MEDFIESLQSHVAHGEGLLHDGRIDRPALDAVERVLIHVKRDQYTVGCVGTLDGNEKPAGPIEIPGK